MRCINCRSEIADGLNFCPNCGTKLSGKKKETAEKTKSSRRDATLKRKRAGLERRFDEGSTIGRYTIKSFLGVNSGLEVPLSGTLSPLLTNIPNLETSTVESDILSPQN